MHGRTEVTINRQEKVCCGGHTLNLGKTQHMVGDKM